MHPSTAAFCSILIASSAFALEIPETKVSMETCLAAALAERPGEVKRLGLEVEEVGPLYEFVIKTKDRGVWELECDANTGKIIEVQQDVSRTDPAFQNAKITEAQARRIAQERHPGKVKGSSPQIYGDGTPVYEVQIETKDGKEVEVDVNATNEAILSAEVESDERRIYVIGEDTKPED